MPTILITEHIHPDAVARLKREPGFEVVEAAGSQRVIQETLDWADAIGVRIMRLDAAMLAEAPRLRVIGKHGVGTDNIDLLACAARGVVVLNTPEANKIAVAEHAMALILALAKRLSPSDAALRHGDWHFRDHVLSEEVAGRSLAILGLGRSGQELARRARAFDMTLLAWGRRVDRGVADALGVRVVATLGEALAAADYVSLHTPRVHPTKPLLGRDEIALMKPGTILINCARGGLVDEVALAEALRDGRLGGAGIDVFDAEPPPGNHPLLAPGLDNVILTPHTAGNTREASRRMGMEMAENIIAGLAGRLDGAPVVRPPSL